MKNTTELPYWEIVDNSLWKQQSIIEFLYDTIGDLYLGENPDDLKRIETRLTAMDALVDSLKIELQHIIPIIQQQVDDKF